MPKVLIIVNAEIKEDGKVKPASPVTEKMVAALKSAIMADSTSNSPSNSPSNSSPIQIEVLPTAILGSNSSKRQLQEPNLIYCPLTIQLPNWLQFPAQEVFQACQDIDGRRQWVEQKLAYKTSRGNSWLGDLWLPILWTKKESLYATIIGEGAMPNAYEQPVNLPEKVRQPLYHLAEQLLKSLTAPPAVYLLQFRLLDQEIIFDRLWPFPAAPAIASLRSQKPDLFTCHWHCLSGKAKLKKLVS